ncbi:MAG: ankyrin repeat domain-containing protein [Gemmataceae bacterium]|nr:ankyrin repeat domain-containing protein [Gemmataceae bacterium]
MAFFSCFGADTVLKSVFVLFQYLFYPIHGLAYAGKADKLRLHLSASAVTVDQLDLFGLSALQYAAAAGMTDAAHVLLSAGANPNKGSGWTPLQYATYSSSRELIRLLLQFGARIDGESTNSRGTALHVAAASCDISIVALLIDSGASCWAIDDHGNIPLHIAAASGNEPVFHLLSSKALNINLKNYEGNTPLDLAMDHGFSV